MIVSYQHDVIYLNFVCLRKFSLITFEFLSYFVVYFYYIIFKALIERDQILMRCFRIYFQFDYYNVFIRKYVYYL